jgi:glycosyltransferase involved in cell wall biosynthesis
MKAKLEEKFPLLPTPIAVIPNYADIGDVLPSKRANNPMRLQYGLKDKFVVLVAGNLGRVQGLEIVIRAARELSSDPAVHFLIVGDGARIDWLRSEIARLRLSNITMAGARPRSEQNTFLTAGDVALLTLERGMVGVGVPSRLYNYLAAGMPVISATGRGSETSLVVEEERLGWCVEPLNGGELAHAVTDAMQRRAELPALGMRARQVAESRFCRDAIVARYSRLVDEMYRGGCTSACLD